jgi:hypothetical protein
MKTCLNYCNLYFVVNNLTMCLLYTNPIVERYQISIIILYLLLIHDFCYYCTNGKNLQLLLLTIFYLSFLNFVLCWNVPLVYFVFLNVLWKYLFIYHETRQEFNDSKKKRHLHTIFSSFAPCENTDDECYICLETNMEKPSLKYLPCSHPFHEECFTEWILSDREKEIVCPVCRRNLLGDDFC